MKILSNLETIFEMSLELYQIKRIIEVEKDEIKMLSNLETIFEVSFPEKDY